MTDVEIQYCAPCGTLDPARQLSGHILDTVDGIDGVRVTNVDEDVFRVLVGDDTVYEETRYDGEEEPIVRALRRRVEEQGA